MPETTLVKKPGARYCSFEPRRTKIDCPQGRLASKRQGNSRPHRVIANATDDGYAAFACLEQRLDNIAADGDQKVGLLRDKFGG